MADTAGVRVPPPLLYAAGLGAGALLDRFLPWAWHEAFPVVSLLGPGTPLVVKLALGLPFLLVGLALDVWALLRMRRAHTTILPWGGASALVTDGPFRLTRNPIYLGYTLEYLGVTLLLGALWPLALLPLVQLAMGRFVIRREEAHLARVFGDDYARYRARVRRWL